MRKTLLVALTALVAFGGGFSDPLAQSGLGIFALSWLGLVYLHLWIEKLP